MAWARPLALIAVLCSAGAATAQPVKAPPPRPRQPRPVIVQPAVDLPVQVAQPPQKAPEPVKESAESNAVKDDEKALREVGLKADGATMLEYFRKRTFPDADAKKIAQLVRDLGDEEFDIREKAYATLAAMGAGATAGLKTAESDRDTEVRRRVADLKQRIEAKAEPAVQAAAARVIARTKPKGAAQVLLAYLPFATEPAVIDEISKTLSTVAIHGGTADPVLVQALTAKAPIQRAVAGEALARAAVKDQLPTVRKLLKDADPVVRLRVSLALVPLKEKEVLPVMVDLLADLPPEQLWQVEEVLVRLAGDKTPAVSLGTSPASRKIARDAWKGWLDKNAASIDLAKLQQPEALLGYTLLVQQTINRIGVGGRRLGGEVIELDANKKPRWRFGVPTYPVAAQYVGRDRVLIAEYQAGRVTERDLKGNVVWEKAAGGNPIGVQRLTNGNTFIVMQNRLVELDRDGKQHFNLQRPQHDIMRAVKLRNGEVVFITNTGVLSRIEGKTQRVLKTFNVGQPQILFGGIDVLPNGHILVPHFQGNRVVEYDGEGKQVKTFNVQWPNSAQRLPNGNTLVASQNSRRVVEFDRTGREIWSHQCDGSVFNARRR